ncbi:hypothetical protein GORHZ_127_00080 [Gordonia rhizosphera NBRC 16068]|uniref:Oligosaccharide repeat unit polymerase n=1 Tax=Gordonia rhizosphera NBRC 16068 TaxID=1108045 RepID=K6WGR4_9ACTN|nr:hypothetical protein GORHZ_127_00080 [Gordonia rhizosphera NBRC 16068]
MFVAAIAITPTFFVTDVEFRALWRTPKSVTSDTLLLFACGALALAFGALVSSSAGTPRRLARPWPALDDRSTSILRRASTVLTSLTMLGYVGFVIVIVREGISPQRLFSGSEDVRSQIGTIPGVTTFTEFGIAAVVAASVLLANRFSRVELLKLLTVVALGVVRAFVNSERLAMLELVVPIVVVIAAKLASEPGIRRRIAQLIPVVFLSMLVVLFGVFEYFRSWSWYRAHGSTSFPHFVVTRLAGYYATSMNNGHLNLTHMDWPNRLPFGTLTGFWLAPGVQNLNLYERLGGHPVPTSDMVLLQFGNPEFNSESGYSAAFLDYGHIGGIIYFLLAGLVVGLLYRGFRSARPFGLMLYPVAFIGLLEMPRYMYWSYGRVVYPWIALGVIIFLLSRRRSEVAT